jgi:hypothetical protein
LNIPVFRKPLWDNWKKGGRPFSNFDVRAEISWPDPSLIILREMDLTKPTGAFLATYYLKNLVVTEIINNTNEADSLRANVK